MSLSKKKSDKKSSIEKIESNEDQVDPGQNDADLIDGEKYNFELDQVDIPIHEDLSEFQNDIHNVQGRIDKIDIDLTDISVGSEIFGESKLLSVNPLKPFSRQVNLNLKALSDQGYITPENSNTLLSNSFRMIKRPMLNIAKGKGSVHPKHPNMIMVTSSVSGEGKSYTAINLAISIAMERDKHVMLVDADVNKPSHHQILGIDAPYGLTDLLLGKVKSMSEVICKTNIPSLSLIFSGKIFNHATELLASQAMDDFIEDVSGRYPDRIVIFDSPPLLMTTEASVLAPHMGQLLLVVEAEKTSKQQVDKSLSLLSNEVVLLLLNKMRVKGDEGGYGYYGYGQTS